MTESTIVSLPRWEMIFRSVILIILFLLMLIPPIMGMSKLSSIGTSFAFGFVSVVIFLVANILLDIKKDKMTVKRNMRYRICIAVAMIILGIFNSFIVWPNGVRNRRGVFLIDRDTHEAEFYKEGSAVDFMIVNPFTTKIVPAIDDINVGLKDFPFYFICSFDDNELARLSEEFPDKNYRSTLNPYAQILLEEVKEKYPDASVVLKEIFLQLNMDNYSDDDAQSVVGAFMAQQVEKKFAERGYTISCEATTANLQELFYSLKQSMQSNYLTVDGRFMTIKLYYEPVDEATAVRMVVNEYPRQPDVKLVMAEVRKYLNEELVPCVRTKVPHMAKLQEIMLGWPTEQSSTKEISEKISQLTANEVRMLDLSKEGLRAVIDPQQQCLKELNMRLSSFDPHFKFDVFFIK